MSSSRYTYLFVGSYPGPDRQRLYRFTRSDGLPLTCTRDETRKLLARKRVTNPAQVF